MSSGVFQIGPLLLIAAVVAVAILVAVVVVVRGRK